MFLLTFRWLKSKAGTIMPAHVKRFGWFNHLIYRVLWRLFLLFPSFFTRPKSKMHSNVANCGQRMQFRAIFGRHKNCKAGTNMPPEVAF